MTRVSCFVFCFVLESLLRLLKNPLARPVVRVIHNIVIKSDRYSAVAWIIQMPVTQIGTGQGTAPSQKSIRGLRGAYGCS